MSNIKKAFENGKAFIAFITCGDPDLETTAAVVRAAVENGADLIELGIPFSDPTADILPAKLPEVLHRSTLSVLRPPCPLSYPVWIISLHGAALLQSFSSTIQHFLNNLQLYIDKPHQK